MTSIPTLQPAVHATMTQRPTTAGVARPQMPGSDAVHFSGAKSTLTKAGIAVAVGAVSEWFMPSIVQNFVNPAVALLTFGGLSMFGSGKSDDTVETQSPDT